jgi:hypothetical protein
LKIWSLVFVCWSNNRFTLCFSMLRKREFLLQVNGKKWWSIRPLDSSCVFHAHKERICLAGRWKKWWSIRPVDSSCVFPCSEKGRGFSLQVQRITIWVCIRGVRRKFATGSHEWTSEVATTRSNFPIISQYTPPICYMDGSTTDYNASPLRGCKHTHW